MNARNVLCFGALCAVLSVLNLKAADGPTTFKAWTEVADTPLRAFTAPLAERVQLPNGMVIFLLENHELPLIEGALTIRVGSIYERNDRLGLTSVLAETLRSGGTVDLPGDQLDEALDSRAASIWSTSSLDSSSAGFTCLREDADKVIGLFRDVLKTPALLDEKIELAQTKARGQVARRNDRPAEITQRESLKLLYGSLAPEVPEKEREKEKKKKDKDKEKGKEKEKELEDFHPYARHAEYETLMAITRQDLVNYHKEFYQPARFILSVTGDFNAAEMKARLEKLFGDWSAQALVAPNLPPPKKSSDRQVLVLRPSLTQTTVSMAHLIDVKRNSPDYPALRMMNEIFSGSMSARLFTEVRTKKGLAYSVFGGANVFYDRPGYLMCSCLTRNEQANDAISAVRYEITRLRDSGVTDSELVRARQNVLNSSVFTFETPDKILTSQRTMEFYGYPLDFETKIIEALKNVTVEQINEVAKKYLDPSALNLLAVTGLASLKDSGKWEELDVTIPAPKQQLLVIDPEREIQGKKVLAEALQVAGGADQFKQLKSIQAGLLLYAGPFSVKGMLKMSGPNKIRVDIDAPFSAITQIVSPDGAWQATGSSVKATSPDEARTNLKSLTQTDLGILRLLAGGEEGFNIQSMGIIKEPASKDGEIPARNLVGVLVESQSLGRIKIYFDEKTKLMAKIKYFPDNNPREVEKRFMGHHAFGPLTLAGRVEDDDPKARAKAVEMSNLTLNPDLPNSLFEKPSKASGASE